MATIIKNGKRWRAQVRKFGVSKSATFLTQADAKKWAEMLEKQLESGKYNEIPDITLDELIDKYLKEVTVTKRGKREERIRLLRLSRTPLAAISLQEIGKAHFREWQNQRLKEVSPATVLRERSSLSALMAKAIEWDFITENPLKYLEKPKAPAPRTRRYDEHEIERLIFVSGYDVEHIEPPKTLQNRTGAAFLFAIETAMRAGEIASLTWNNINFEKRTAFLPITKNGHSRTVPLSVKAIEILQHLTSVKTESDPRVFQMEARQLDHNFRKLKKMAGLENANLHFHDTRREALTRLAEKVDVMVLAKISGHRDLSILQNTYYAPDMSEIAQRL